MHCMTQSEIDKHGQKIIKAAKEYKANGMSEQQISAKIWNKYGYSNEVKNGKIKFQQKYNGKGQQTFTVEAEI